MLLGSRGFELEEDEEEVEEVEVEEAFANNGVPQLPVDIPHSFEAGNRSDVRRSAGQPCGHEYA